MKYFNFKYSILTLIIINLVFQIINLIYFTAVANSNGRIINNLMISLVIILYTFSVVGNKTVMNRFQIFLSNAILFSLRNFCDDIQYTNTFYAIGLIVFNLIGIYDVFYIKKDFGEFFLDFIFIKNWFK